MKLKIKQYAQALADAMLPRTCAVCEHVLDADERYVCRDCWSKLPRTYYERTQFNAMEQRFAGKVRIERATAYFFYEKTSPYASIIHNIKYRNMANMGRRIAARAVTDIAYSGFFDDIDVVVPVPLHRDKLAQRGYNQAEMIARGIAQHTGAVVADVLTSVKSHSTQTHKGAYERWVNTRDTYVATPRAVAELTGKHVLLVDDVVTTGATLLACAEAIAAIPNVKISLFTLAAARLD